MKKHVNYSISLKINIILLLQVIFILAILLGGYMISMSESQNSILISTISRIKTNSQKIALLAELAVDNKLSAKDDLQEIIDKNQKLFHSFVKKTESDSKHQTPENEFHFEVHEQIAIDSLNSLWMEYKSMAENIISLPLYVDKNITRHITDSIGNSLNTFEVKTEFNPIVMQSKQFIEQKSDDMLYRSDYIIGMQLNKISVLQQKYQYFKYFMLLLSILTTIWAIFWVRNNVLFRVVRLAKYMENAATGLLETIPRTTINDEVENVGQSYNDLINKLNAINTYIKELSKENYNSDIQTIETQDPIWKSIELLRINLLNSRNEENKRKEEDFLRNWVNNGLAQIGDILRQNNENIVLLGDTILKFLLNYINAQQGGIFLYNPERSKDTLDLLTTFAYGKRKMLEKKIKLGQGLIGICALERNTLHIDKVPEDYFEISSGFGGTKPNSLLIVPLKMESNLLGVIELASFSEFKPHIIELVEKSAASIALTLQTAQNNIRTVKLLEQSQIQAEELSNREAEFKKIIYDMKTFQERAEARELDLNSTLHAIDNALGMFELNNQGQYLNYNQLYLSTIEADGSNLKYLYHKNLIDTDYYETPYTQVFNFMQKGMAFQRESRYKTKSNNNVYLLEYYTPVINANGDLIKILVLTTNISKNKEQEQWLLSRTQEIEKQDDAMKQNFEEMMQVQQELVEKEDLYKKQLTDAYEMIAELKRKKME